MNKKFSNVFDSLKKEENKKNAIEFWKALESNADGNQFANSVVHMIYNQIVFPEKKQSFHQKQQRMLSTLLVLEYYKSPKCLNVEEMRKNFNDKKNKINALPKWILSLHFERIAPTRPMNFIHQIFSKLFKCPIDMKEDDDPADSINNEIKECKKYLDYLEKQDEEEKYFSQLKLVSFPQMSGLDLRYLSFGYIIYLDQIRKRNYNNVPFQIYEHLIKILKIHVNAFSHRQGKTIPYFLKLIHLISQSIIFFGCPYESILKQFLVWASQIRCCPEIVGEYGHQFFELVHNQLKSPGHAFRKKLRYDFPTLDIKESKFLNKPYYLISPSDTTVNETAVLNTLDYCSLLNLRKLIIWQILKTSGFQKKQLLDHKNTLKIIGDKEAFGLYFKSMKIVELASSLEVYDKIKKVQNQSMGQLMKIIKRQYQKIQGLDKATKLDIQEFESLCTDHQIGIFQYPNYEIINVSLKDFISGNKSEYSFQQIARRNRIQFPQLNFYQNKIPIIFYGTSSHFSLIVHTIAEYIEKTDVQKSRLLRVFYIPSDDKKNKQGISLYLASKDIWYRRFIFNVFRHKMIFPFLKPCEQAKNLLPYELFKKTIQMYLRQAKSTFPLRVYTCDIKLRGENKIHSLYMTSFFMMGIFAQADYIRKSKMDVPEKQKKYANMENIEIVCEKLKKYTPMNLSIWYSKEKAKEQGGQKIYHEDRVKIQDLQICNLPRQYFMGNPPNPVKDQLQMAILTESSGKSFRRQIANKQNFKRYHQNQIRQAFKQFFACSQVNTITIECHDRQENIPFAIVDGTAYHNVQKVSIRPTYSKNNLPVSIPIQCFMKFK